MYNVLHTILHNRRVLSKGAFSSNVALILTMEQPHCPPSLISLCVCVIIMDILLLLDKGVWLAKSVRLAMKCEC